MVETDLPRILYVAWQSPESRRFWPVGRLVVRDRDGVEEFEFAYVHSAREADAEGFRPFQNFPDLGRVYHSGELFPFFANRVIGRGRPDFAKHVGYYRLDPETADPIDLLSRSGGQRATDSVVIFPVPVFESESDCYVTYFLVHGLRHLDPSAQERVLQFHSEEELTVAPVPDNPADPDAVQLRTREGHLVGYLPRYLTKEARGLLKDCGFLRITVESVNPPPAPFQQRLLCRMSSCWPLKFLPFADPAFRPIATEAAQLTPADFGAEWFDPLANID